jgi:pimeloyl-ACP methyl ester carboxylesterase
MNGSKTSDRKRAAGTHDGRQPSSKKLWTWGAAAGGAALAGAAVYNHLAARRAEEKNPPVGKFLTVNGVKLHYLERGKGTPILLLHGNGTMIEDWVVSGLFDALAETNRVIAIDRPGFGHSDRPRSRVWTPATQARLFTEALRTLGADKPLVIGHSFGTLVAVEMALANPGSLAGLVLLGGYYYPTVRIDVPFAAQPAIPVTGDIMRYTVSPLIGAAMMPRVNARIFNPAPVPSSWIEGFPFEMSLRPFQIRSEAAEAAMMIPAAAALTGRLEGLDLPVTIVAGSGDEMVDTGVQSKQLHEALPKSRFVEAKGAGHMVHHTALDTVLKAIRAA